MRLPEDRETAPHFRRLGFQLDDGRKVELEGCNIVPTTLSFWEGSKVRIREIVVSKIDKLANDGMGKGSYIKPIPEGELPLFTIHVNLVSYAPVKPCDDDGTAISTLTIGWLTDDIETSLPELIDREISSVPWDQYALDGWL
jgi:hypothetical protein